MNGRALNEKAIEVSPSSSRVLDRAAEILTPFPPSKNRPRPGDWTCPSCGFSNFQRRNACFRCSFSAVSAAPSGDRLGYSPYGYGPPSVFPHAPHHLGHGGHGIGHSRGMGHSGGMVPFRAGDWKCGNEGCGYHNFAKNVTCLRCGASRATAAVVAESGFSSPLDAPTGYGMMPSAVNNAAGPSPFVSAAAPFPSAPPFAAQHYPGPASTYALPSGLGTATGPYAPMAPHFGPTGQSLSAGPLDSRAAAEVAFTNAAHGPSTGGPANGFYASQPDDPFAFLSAGIGGLTVVDDRRDKLNGDRTNKSPA
jgi:hypothetical protein